MYNRTRCRWLVQSKDGRGWFGLGNFLGRVKGDHKNDVFFYHLSLHQWWQRSIFCLLQQANKFGGPLEPGTAWIKVTGKKKDPNFNLHSKGKDSADTTIYILNIQSLTHHRSFDCTSIYSIRHTLPCK